METINPTNFIDIDPDTVSFVTLKNGNMLMLDDSAPEQPHKGPTELSYTQNNVKKIYKCSKTQNIFYKGMPKDLTQIVIKSNFNNISKMIRNIYFSYYPSIIKKYEKMASLNSSIEFKQSSLPSKRENNNNIQNKNNENFNELFLETNFSRNNNNEKNHFNKNNISKNDTIQQFSNYIDSAKNNNNYFNENNLINNSNILNNNINNNNKNEKSLESKYINSNNNTNKQQENNYNKDTNRSSMSQKYNRINRGKTPRIKKDKNYIKAVISINIPADEGGNVNIIQQFNSLVDRLNEQKFKNKKEKEIVKKTSDKYYELYKKTNESYYNNINSNLSRMGKKKSTIELTQNSIFNNTKINNFSKINSFNNRILTIKEKSFSDFYKVNENSGRRFSKGSISDIVFPSNFSFQK